MNIAKQSTQTPIFYSRMKTGNQIHCGCANCVSLPVSCMHQPHALLHNLLLIGASLSKPHIYSYKRYSCARIVYGTSVTRNIICPARHGSMDISAKYSIAHSHAWAIGRIYIVLI